MDPPRHHLDPDHASMHAAPVVSTRHWLTACLILASMALLLRTGLTEQSPTIDEPFHLFRGIAWWSGTPKMSYAHPPLANVLTAAPGAWGWPTIDLSTLEGWDTRDIATVAEAYLETDYETARAQLMAGRKVMAAIALLLAASVGGWVTRRFGADAGVVALALVAWNPTIIAHGQLVTTDLPAAFVLFLAVAALVEHLDPRAPPAGWRWAIGPVVLGLATGTALATKFSTLLFIPVAGVLGLGAAMLGRGRYRGAPIARSLRLAADLAVVAVLAVLIIDAMYGFGRTGLRVSRLLSVPEPQCYLTERFGHQMLEQRSMLRHLPGWLRIPLPYPWIFGVEMVRYQGDLGHPTWFMGQRMRHGDITYFPWMLLLKTPPVVWVGLVLAALRWRGRRPQAAAWVPLLMAAVLLSMLLRTKVNIGVRYALPMLPLLSAVSAVGLVAGVHRLLPRWTRTRRIGVLGAGLLTAGVPATLAAGHSLSWFVIGPKGHDISMVGEDWGQDVAALGQRATEEHWAPVYYDPYGGAAKHELGRWLPDWQRLRCGDERPGWHVRHAADQLRKPQCEEGEPDHIINHHIYVWDRREASNETTAP